MAQKLFGLVRDAALPWRLALSVVIENQRMLNSRLWNYQPPWAPQTPGSPNGGTVPAVRTAVMLPVLQHGTLFSISQTLAAQLPLAMAAVPSMAVDTPVFLGDIAARRAQHDLMRSDARL
jgi:hypothetical protein